MIRVSLFLILAASHVASNLSEKVCSTPDGHGWYSLRFSTPPVIYSIPGSGNTMVRLLIDAALGHGYYTGSVYLDKSLKDTLPGEMLCHAGMPAIKAHPFMVIVPHARRKSLRYLRNSSFANIFARHDADSKTNKCAPCIHTKFKAALVVTRNPIRAAFADFNRAVAKRGGNSHTSRLKKEKFKLRRFEEYMKLFAEGVKETYEQDYQAGIVEKLPAENSLFVRFEDLVNKRIDVRIFTLRKIMKFLLRDSNKIPNEQLAHAFKLAEREHRGEAEEGDLMFKDAFTMPNRRIFWNIVRNSTKGLGGYVPPFKINYV